MGVGVIRPGSGNDEPVRTIVQDRLIAGTGAGIVVAGFGYLLFLGLLVRFPIRVEQPMAVLSLEALRPAPRPEHVAEHPKSRASSGKASPRNLRNKATDVVALPPLLLPMPSPPIVSAPTPGLGMAASAGASDRPGPGQGAGGERSGTGSGRYGDGEGDGGQPPRQIRGRLKFSDLPADLRALLKEASVGVRFYVNADGRVGDCSVTRSSGQPELDAMTCRLIQQRFRYDPSRDENGRPVRSIIEENHSWSVDRSEQEQLSG